MTQFHKDTLHTVVAVVLCAAAATALLTRADIRVDAKISDKAAAPEAIAEAPAEIPLELSEGQIDYLQWVLKEAGTDTPLSAYPDTGIRADVQFARGLTDEERFELWFQLEALRGAAYELAPQGKGSSILG